MCTAISMKKDKHYFGRNLDIDRSYGEEICIMPRNFPLKFKTAGEMSRHYAVIGMASIMNGIPLFYDAVNEHGLAIAGLNFPHNAYYGETENEKDNIAPFEFIPWILGQCKTVDEANVLLGKINIADIPFSREVGNTPLHWIICDDKKTLVAEPMRDCLHIYENTADILTNNPPFPYQMENLGKYKNLRTYNPADCQTENKEYSSYSQGLGAVGLPGDVSSQSRFVRAVFNLKNSVCENNELSQIGQFFHLLSSVEMVKGTCKTADCTLDFTLYSCCMDTKRGLYYYTTYRNRQISCVNMYNTDLNSETLSRFPIISKENIFYQN